MITKPVQQKQNTDRGFTIVEMVVVISIFGVLAGLVLFRYKSYQANINLENTAQDIALEIQKAENDAISGRYPTLVNQAQTPPPAGWRPSYGVYFDSNPNNNHQKQFAIFFDRESLQQSDSLYQDPGVNGRAGLSDGATVFNTCGVATSECIRTITITNDVSIVKTCEGSMLDCTNMPSSYGIGNISLVFTRPFPELIALKNAIGVGNYSGSTYRTTGDIRIRVQSDTTGLMRDIVVSPLGQIHLETVQ